MPNRNQRRRARKRNRNGQVRGPMGKQQNDQLKLDPLPQSLSLRDTLTLDYSEKFTVSFNNTTHSRYFIATGGVWLSELVGTPAAYTLPATNYYGNIVGMMPNQYRWVEIDRLEVKFVPASLHVGNVWSAFQRNQLLITDSDLDYPQVEDLSNAPGVRSFEFDQGFSASYSPVQVAKQCAVPWKLKAGVVGNANDFQYPPAGSKYIVMNFSPPQNLINNTLMGTIYMRWVITFRGRLPN